MENAAKRFSAMCTTIFSGSGKLEKIHDMLVKEVRKMVGKNETPSVGIIDSQSVLKKGIYRVCKKIKGRKRHIIVDTVGLVIAAEVHSAKIVKEL